MHDVHVLVVDLNSSYIQIYVSH